MSACVSVSKHSDVVVVVVNNPKDYIFIVELQRSYVSYRRISTFYFTSLVKHECQYLSVYVCVVYKLNEPIPWLVFRPMATRATFST